MVSTARSLLPPDAYWSTEWFDRERDQLFGRCWNLVGTLDDLPGGRRIVADVAGWTVWVERAADGRLVARRLTGDAAADVWAGYVFVTIDPAGSPTLAAWLGEFPERIGGYRPDLLVEVARYRFALGANWKLFVENHVDVYHLWHLHGESLGAYDHRRAEWSMCGPHWVFYEPPRAGVDVHDARFWRGLRPISHVGEDRWGSGAHLIFPNLTLATGAGFFMTYQCIPVGPERSVVDLRVRAVAGSDPSAMLEMSRTVIEREDGAACEAMQAAVRSPWFGVGPLACEHELPITRFHEQVLSRMAA
jgi:Rieske 2Fe-2S family protein